MWECGSFKYQATMIVEVFGYRRIFEWYLYYVKYGIPTQMNGIEFFTVYG